MGHHTSIFAVGNLWKSKTNQLLVFMVNFRENKSNHAKLNNTTFPSLCSNDDLHQLLFKVKWLLDSYAD